MAQQLMPLLGVSQTDLHIEIDVRAPSLNVEGGQVFDLRTAQNGIELKAVCGQVGPKICKLTVKGLSAAASYQLFVDDKSNGKANGAAFAAGLAFGSPFVVGESKPTLLQTIAEKNALFFNRHRPQNETYLFLFRKHEQGNNAVEIPQFDPLIAEKEKEIAAMKKPVIHKFELKLAE